MPGYTERFEFYPGLEQITEIEGVDIIDAAAPSPIEGVGSGVVALVGEFEKFQTDPMEVFGWADLEAKFGYDNPGVGDIIDYSIGSEKYFRVEGNGYLKLRTGLKFRRLVLVSVDDSVGVVTFTRQNPGFGSIETDDGPFSFHGVTSPANLTVDFNSAAVTASMTLAFDDASIIGTGASFAAGDGSKALVFDLTTEDDTVSYTAYPTAAETSLSTWLTFLNANYPGIYFTEDGGEIRATTERKGNAQGIAINTTDSHADMLASVGMAASGSDSGSGDVANHLAVTAQELYDEWVKDAAASAATWTAQVSGQKFVLSTTTAGSGGDVQCDTATSTMENQLGGDFSSGALNAGGSGTAGALTVPAGTTLTGGGGSWLTMQDAVFSDDDGTGSPVLSVANIKVRAQDQNPSGLTTSGIIDTIDSNANIQGDDDSQVGLAVINPDALTERPETEADWASLYDTAFDKLLNQDGPSPDVNIILSARSSASDGTATAGTVQKKAISTAVTKSASGAIGCVACVSPPLGTTTTVANSSSGLGVGAVGANERGIYCYPGARYFNKSLIIWESESDGYFDCTSDIAMASVLSQLPPERNPGQLTSFAKFTALESSTKSGGTVGPLTIDNYKAFKRNGIAAPRMWNGVAIFQSGVTSSTVSGKTKINRRRFADFIQGSIAIALMPDVKELGTDTKKDEIEGKVNSFLNSLANPPNPDAQRLDSFSVVRSDEPIFTLSIGAKMLSTLDDIVLNTEVGDDVVVSEG